MQQKSKEEIIKQRYPFYNPDIAMKDVELNGEQVMELMESYASQFKSQPPTGTASGGYSLEQVEKIALEAAKYGFNYRDISQHNGEVPEGNVLQWLQNFLQSETK